MIRSACEEIRSDYEEFKTCREEIEDVGLWYNANRLLNNDGKRSIKTCRRKFKAGRLLIKGCSGSDKT